jgi:hypothetical protein
MLGTGLLGWLRLTPLGEVHWTGAGDLLQWLAWIAPGYALGAGLLQARSRSVLAYAGVALNGLWLAMLSTVLTHPQAWHGMPQGIRATVLQSGLALAALLVLDRRMSRNVPNALRHLPSSLMWIAALLLVTAPMGIRGSMAGADDMAALQVSWVTVSLAFLVVRALLSITPAIDSPCEENTVLPPRVPGVPTLRVAEVLVATALLTTVYNLFGLSAAELWLILLTVPIAYLAAWLTVERLVPLLPALPPGVLLVPLGKGLAATLGRARSLADTYLPLWRDSTRALLRRLRSGADWRRSVGQFESDLNRWPVVLMALLLLGLTVAWLGTRQ